MKAHRKKTAAIPRVGFKTDRTDDESDFNMSRGYFKIFDSGSYTKAARLFNYLKLMGAVLHTNIFVPVDWGPPLRSRRAGLARGENHQGAVIIMPVHGFVPRRR